MVDYAERWPAVDLTALLTHSIAQGRRARVLLVARPAGLWWQTLAQYLDRHLDLDSETLPLPPLAEEPSPVHSG
ncbi:hypothetical protein B4N89_46770 [Embleya scabrispora]|uniref:Uncharacterized protein n=1 Tax=Embleya scabrispora TaxID=159449 RepID=A0A1T3NIV7_9ACTN|nr:hypothetical protein B4N89_46770 [Embleya scabrispora]